MWKLLDRGSMSSRRLRFQLIASFCLMTVIPVLALVNLIVPSAIDRQHVPYVLVSIFLLALLGFFWMKQVVDAIIHISSGVKCLVAGEVSPKINVSRHDEIGELSQSLNQLAGRIQSRMDELQIYGDRTKDISSQLNRQFMTLSGLLEIGGLMIQGAEVEGILDIVISRLLKTTESDVAFILLRTESGFDVAVQQGCQGRELELMSSPATVSLWDEVLDAKGFFKADIETSDDTTVREILQCIQVKSLIAQPMIGAGRHLGLLGVGRRVSSVGFSQQDQHLLEVYATQLTVAFEQDSLSKRVQSLEIKDHLTGLYNRSYILNRLDEEICRSILHQGPCSLVVIKIKNLQDIRARSGQTIAENILIKTADMLKSSFSQIDRVGRLDEDLFGVVLPEKNKRKAQEVALRVKERLSEMFRGPDQDFVPQMWTGVAENPIDGADAEKLLGKACSFV